MQTSEKILLAGGILAVGGTTLYFLTRPAQARPSQNTYFVVRGLDDKIYWKDSKEVTWNKIPSGTVIDTPAAEYKDGFLDLFVKGGVDPATGENTLWYGRVNVATKEFSGWTNIYGLTRSAPCIA